jgi:hypothetical protein
VFGTETIELFLSSSYDQFASLGDLTAEQAGRVW